MAVRSAASPTLTFPVGLEEGPDGAVLVHSFSIPGCVAAGGSHDEALAAFPAVLSEWLGFLGSAGEAVPPAERELEIRVDEWRRSGADLRGGESVACFAADRVALGDAEIAHALRWLGELRGRVLPRIRRRPDAELERMGPAGASARQVLDELARAQWWTLSRLGASSLAAVPGGLTARLDTAMALVVQRFADLPRDARGRSLEIDGEEWTPRKVLRRLLWLEWSLGHAALIALEEDGPLA